MRLFTRRADIDTVTTTKSRLRLAAPVVAAAFVEQENDTEATDDARYAKELDPCPGCGMNLTGDADVCACGYKRPVTAAFGAFDESKVVRRPKGDRGGGQFTVKGNAAGRFEVVDEATGKKVGETTDPADAQTLADEKNAAPSPVEGPFKYPSGWEGKYDPVEGRYLGMDDIYMPADFDPSRPAGGSSAMSTPDPSRAERVRRISGLANAGAEGQTRADGPSHMDYSPDDLRQTLSDSDSLTPAGRANIERTLALDTQHENEMMARNDQASRDKAESSYFGGHPGNAINSPAPVSPREMFHAGAEAAIRQGEQGDSLSKSNANAARAAVRALESGDVIATDDDYRAALDRLNRVGGTPERSQLNSQLDVVKGLAIGRLPRRGNTTASLAMWVDDPEAEALVAAIPVNPPAEWFFAEEPDEPQAMSITADGFVSGHAAIWGTCHLGNPRGAGVCVQPPVSNTDYGLFHLGEILADGGEKIPVGQITLDTGHAPIGASARTAAAHYDDTGAAVVDVRAVNGRHGIWFSGALRPGVTARQVRALMASKISGDWRGGELVGMLCVNVPGFPVPRPQARLVASAGSEQVMALVAAGIVGEARSFADVSIEVALLAAAAEGRDPIDALVELAEA